MDRKSALQPYRGSLVVSTSTLAVAVLLSIVLWRLGLNGQPLVRAVAEGSLPLSLAAGILLVVAAATVAIHISVTPPSPSNSSAKPPIADFRLAIADWRLAQLTGNGCSGLGRVSAKT